MEAQAFDIIIAGGGTAGLVLATRLSELHDIHVLVIEAGHDLTKDPRVSIPAFAPALVGTSADWQIQTSPQASLSGRQLSNPQGRALGGSSALNSHTFTPTSKANVDAWASLGNEGWEWESFSKSINSSYTFTKSPQDINGGTNGPLQLSIPTEETQWPQVWREAISKLGYPVSNDPFSGHFQGALITPETIHPDTKERSFAGSAYLSVAQSRQNLTIWTETSVDKVLFDTLQGKPIATGVQYTRDGKFAVVRARKEVIISAGAIHSPKILESSGIGNANLLQSLGIEVIIDNPYVGENLQNHPVCSVTFQVSSTEGFETIDDLARHDHGALAAATEAYSKDRTGPFARSSIDIMAQLSLPDIGTSEGARKLDRLLKDTAHKARDTGEATTAFAMAHRSFVNSILASPTGMSAQYMTCPCFAVYGLDGKMIAIPPGNEKYFSAAVTLAHPLSRGSVHITPSGLNVDPKYLSHPLDVEILSRHVQQLETIMTTEPFPKHLVLDGVRNPAVSSPGSLGDLDNARAFVINSAAGVHHFTGTCSMMPREMGGVVDAKLRVHGCQNLRVCDASIIPIIPGVSPQATVYGVAEHGAGIIKTAYV